MSNENSVKIERTFDAPVDLVWRLWTDPNHFQSWYGPRGASIPVAKMDVREGGQRLICMEMQMPDRTMTMWTVGKFTEVSPTSRLCYTESMSDENGNVLSPAAMGMPEGHPETTEVIVELEEVNGGTKMTMTHVGIPAGSPGEGGWNMAFDKLGDHLAAVQG